MTMCAKAEDERLERARLQPCRTTLLRTAALAAEGRTSGPEGQRSSFVSGTTEVVPFQNRPSTSVYSANSALAPESAASTTNEHTRTR